MSQMPGWPALSLSFRPTETESSGNTQVMGLENPFFSSSCFQAVLLYWNGAVLIYMGLTPRLYIGLCDCKCDCLTVHVMSDYT